MDKYVSPTMEICEFKDEDIITASNLSDALLEWAEPKDNATTAELAKSELKEVLDE